MDYLVRATALDGRVRAFALDASGVVRELQRRHQMYPVPTAAVGRTAMGALLLAAASLKKGDQVLTVEIRGGGPIGRILCTANGKGEVRGLASNPQVHAENVRPGKLNVAGVVGSEGYLSVTKDLGMRDSYRGTVELQTGEVGDDLAYYLSRSEQVPSAVGLGVFVVPDGAVEAAGGFLIQLLPGLKDAEIERIEKEVAALPHPTSLIRDGVRPEQVLARVFSNRVEILDSYPVRFGCPCSRERFESALITLGIEELTKIIEEEDKEYTELVCHFCNEAYHFAPADMDAILRSAAF
ncbi:MAG: Hsp33 family molecular chaperone HslO [Gemmatimonas sp.]|nr:Hsp33 family molecular chaperone HslO [Gemmatimonas sp.]